LEHWTRVAEVIDAEASTTNDPDLTARVGILRDAVHSHVGPDATGCPDCGPNPVQCPTWRRSESFGLTWLMNRTGLAR